MNLTDTQISDICIETSRGFSVNLDEGNCAVFAMALHEFLGSDPSDYFECILLLSTGEEDCEMFEPMFEHVLLNHNGKSFDSKGIHSSSNVDRMMEFILNDEDPYCADVDIFDFKISEFPLLLRSTKPTTNKDAVLAALQRSSRKLGYT